MSDEKKWFQDDFQKDSTPQNGRVFDGADLNADPAPSSGSKQSREEKVKEAFERLFKEKDGGANPPREGGAKRRRQLWPWLVVLALLIILLQGAYIVPEGQKAFVTQFGKIISIQENPGLHVRIPFIQKVEYLTDKIMVYDVSPSEVLTQDKKAMIVDSYALWRISDVTRYIRTVGNIPETQKRMDASVYSNIKNLMGGLEQSVIISDEESSRDSLNTQVTQLVNEQMSGYGVEVLRVEIRRYDLPKDNLSAVYKRMISERQQMAAKFKAEGELEAAQIRNATDKEKDILIGLARADAEKLSGEAEKEYMTILGEVYGDKDKADFYNFMLQLDSLKQSLKGQKTVVLGPDSPLAEMLGGID